MAQPPPNADFQNIGKAFADHYYNTFSGPAPAFDGSTRANLQTLYQDRSFCTWDGEQMMGMQAIMTKLTTFQAVTYPGITSLQHKMTTCDCQPITQGSGVLVVITGDMIANGNAAAPVKFSQVFVLLPTPTGGWYIAHDMFRTSGVVSINPPNQADKSDVGKAFTDHFYQTFDTNRAGLATLYQDTSLLTFEKDQFMGMQPIMTKLTTLAFTQVQHSVATCDCHPYQDTGVLIMVVGELAVDGETTKPLKFLQSFVLMPAAGSWFINHDIFRLNYG